MALIIAVVLGFILLIRLGADKAASKESDRRQTKRLAEYKAFEAAVRDDELERRIEKELWTAESTRKVDAVIDSIPEVAKMRALNKKNQDWFYRQSIRKLILMAEYGKLPLLEGIMGPKMWSCAGELNKYNFSWDAEKALARWIQSKLREHGVNAQIVYDDGKKPVWDMRLEKYVSGHEFPTFEWEPRYYGGDYGERL